MSALRRLGPWLVLVLLAGCAAGPPPPTEAAAGTPVARVPIEEVATEVARALRDRDFAALAAHVHPVEGVRFSPYPYVDAEAHLALTATELTAAAESSAVRQWGHHDGSGEPIRLSFRDYVDRFVYDAPYLEEATVGVDRLQPTGNALDNLRAIYPGARVVEYYVPGSDPRYGGMDWRSLRLVFEPGEGGRHWWLVGVVHGEWTI